MTPRARAERLLDEAVQLCRRAERLTAEAYDLLDPLPNNERAIRRLLRKVESMELTMGANRDHHEARAKGLHMIGRDRRYDRRRRLPGSTLRKVKWDHITHARLTRPIISFSGYR